jgi:hypothetical protein
MYKPCSIFLSAFWLCGEDVSSGCGYLINAYYAFIIINQLQVKFELCEKNLTNHCIKWALTKLYQNLATYYAYFYKCKMNSNCIKRVLQLLKCKHLVGLNPFVNNAFTKAGDIIYVTTAKKIVVK